MNKRLTIVLETALSLTLLTLTTDAADPAGVAIPRPLQIEHKELHNDLVKATKLRGATGEAARRVAALLHEHFAKEEEYALPPLGLLRQLAQGKVPADATNILRQTEKLKADLPQMLAEHKAIVAALEELTSAAQKQKHKDVIRFAEKLKVHAETEEQVLYPAAILVGEYLKARMHR